MGDLVGGCELGRHHSHGRHVNRAQAPGACADSGADRHRAHENSLEGDFWPRYDLFNIALAVIDQVALAMGISAGKSWDEALEYATGQAARQVPDADRPQWARVAERVLVSLVTTDIENVPYLVHTQEGPQWKGQRFWLLRLERGRDGQGFLRASEQAINIFIDALDLDIESAQVANEAQLQALIARGAVESAVQIARHARYRSIQYQERIRRIIVDTLIDPDAHDWVTDVPALLDNALSHVKERLVAEAALMNAVAERRAQMHEQAKVAAANQLIEILRECRHRHDGLHGHLIGARARLREALDDRFSRPPRAAHRSDIASDLLSPYLARSTRDSAAIADRMLAIVGGLSASWWPTLAVLTDELCAPAREPQAGEEFVEPEFADADEPEWWEPYEDTATAIFDRIEEPVRLSQLLARAEHDAGRVVDADGEPLDPGLLAATIVHAAHRSWAASMSGRSEGDRVVAGVTTGHVIDSADVRSADLLLVPGIVTADIQPPTAHGIQEVQP